MGRSHQTKDLTTLFEKVPVIGTPYEDTMHASSTRRARYLRQAFDLTPSEWDEILAHQGGVCFICQRPIDPPRKPHTDHDHKTGHVRGILCSQCNRALGKVEDPRWGWTFRHLLRAAAYLRSYPATEALGRIIRGYPGKIGTKRYRTWAKKNPR